MTEVTHKLTPCQEFGDTAHLKGYQCTNSRYQVHNCKMFGHFTRECKAPRRISDANVQCIHHEEDQSHSENSFLGDIYTTTVTTLVSPKCRQADTTLNVLRT